MQGFQNQKLDKWDVKEKHSLKKQHEWSKSGSESKIFVRGMSEIPFNYLPWNLSKSYFFKCTKVHRFFAGIENQTMGQ